MPIRVVLADDHPPLRLGLRALLSASPDFEVVGEAGDGETALALLERLQPDVAVLDIRLPQRDGLTIAREIRRRGWPIRVLLLSAYEDEALIQEALAIGVDGYLLKQEDVETIAAAVRSAAQGLAAFSRPVLAKMRTLRGEGLTEREREILALAAEGLTNRAIAQRLGISPRTVEYHLSQIFGRLGVSDRAAAVREALRRGWLREAAGEEPPSPPTDRA
ncbi:MAG: response regulator transcription factor [Thermoflexus sp.]|uniref:response regulator transcription factor n=1 Tax=Thermoflexus sp. TaxID=1969742 RepID=UPI0025D485B9|nr:response regulator transcription factor [Thermoflexus sp.]MCS6963719.1 response regulator transcription factor [Thermoflexus sp.]MDW8185026.1 response regulator transcription factor [Anaerolineae bacterium]